MGSRMERTAAMRMIRWLAAYLAPYKKESLLGPLCMAAAAAADLAQPYLTQRMIDDGIARGDSPMVFSLGAALVLLALISFAAGYLNVVYAAKAAVGMAADLRYDLFAKIQTLSFRNIDELRTGDLIVRLTNDITQIQNFVMQMFRILIRSPFIAVGALVMALATSWALSPILLLMVAMMIVILLVLIRWSFPLFLKSQQALDALNRVLNENLSGMRAVKAFVREAFEVRSFAGYNDDLTMKNIRAVHVVILILPLVVLCVNLAIAAVLWLGGNLYQSGDLQIGAIVAFINYLMQLTAAVMIAGMLMMLVSRALVSGRRVMEVLDSKPAVVESGAARTIDQLSGKIAFEHVYFSYDDTEDWVLKDIHFTIEPGRTVGIIGPTGAGKSTLAQLIPRFYDAVRGRVLLDGQDVKTWTEATLRRNISIVLQKAVLFSGSIMENIKYGNPQARFDEVVHAARTAQAREFIERLAEKYDTVLYQRGGNLSGGQRQRVAIARGIVKKPAILILDDSSSALDAKSEALVKEAIAHQLTGVTCILIAQKIASIVNADMILVIDHGEIKARGTHKELLRTSAVYQEIYQSQQGGEDAAYAGCDR